MLGYTEACHLIDHAIFTISPIRKGLSLYKHKWNAGPVDSEEDFRKEVISRAVFRGLADPGDGGMDFPDDGPAPIAAFRRGQSQPATAADLPPTDMSFADSKLTRLTSTGAPGSSSSAAAAAGPSSSGSPFDETLNEVVSVKCPREQV